MYDKIHYKKKKKNLLQWKKKKNNDSVKNNSSPYDWIKLIFSSFLLEEEQEKEI